MTPIDYKGYKIIIDYDQFIDDPLSWTTPEERRAWFVMSHRNYNVPNELDVDFDDYNGWPEVAKALANGRPYNFVNWYEHGGVAVSLQDDSTPSDRWDAGIVGIIIGETTDDIKSAFINWKQYIEGDVYTVTVEDQDGEVIDSLGQVYGYDEAEREGRDIVDYQLTLPRSTHKPKTARELHG